mmetsp:Transcript_51327/g.133354  ORF Transcript_51327/g.133354 Transcript_51327/m.133354 type:complete len:227 (-) Transcript_51327:220-900(-)
MEAPVRAPKRCWAASPPAPWHAGIAPSKHPIPFMRPIDKAMDVCETGRSGNRSSESRHTETMELSVVSGSCGSAAAKRACVTSAAVAFRIAHETGDTGSTSNVAFVLTNRMVASANPARKRISAMGTRGQWRASRTAMKQRLAMATPQTPSASSSETMLSPLRIRDSPSPSCMPLTTDSGTTLLMRRMPRVAPSVNTMTATSRPARLTCTRESPSASATAAIVFIG